MNKLNISKKIILSVLILFFTTSLYSSRIPGSYNKYRETNNFIKELGLRVKPKNGFFEHYYMKVKKTDKVFMELEMDIIYSVFDDPKTTSQWFEMTTKSKKWGKTSFKMLYSDGLLKGDILRLMLAVKAHNPFELPLSSMTKELKDGVDLQEKKKEEKILFKFIKNSKVTIGGNVYKIKVYKNKKIKLEYGLIDEKDTKLFGIAYAKSPQMEIYLKMFGENGVSVFPKKVPVLEMVKNMARMNESFMNKEKEKEDARKEEEEIENSGEKIDDPIERLNKMLEEETKGQ